MVRQAHQPPAMRSWELFSWSVGRFRYSYYRANEGLPRPHPDPLLEEREEAKIGRFWGDCHFLI